MPQPEPSLVPIPVIDVDPAQEPAVAALLAEPDRFALLLAQARRSYTPAGLGRVLELRR